MLEPIKVIVAFTVFLLLNSGNAFSADLSEYFPNDSGSYWKYNYVYSQGDRGGSESDSGCLEKQIIESSQNRIKVRNIFTIAQTIYAGCGNGNPSCFVDTVSFSEPETTYTTFSKLDSFWILDSDNRFDHFAPNAIGVIDSFNLNWQAQSNCDTNQQYGYSSAFCLSATAPDTLLLLGRLYEKYRYVAKVGLIQFSDILFGESMSHKFTLNLLEFRCGNTSTESKALQHRYANKIDCSPNPFTSSTKIAFNLSSFGDAKLTVFSINGEIIKNLSNSFLSAGNHQIVWNGRSNSGAMLAPGSYMLRLEVNGMSHNKIISITR